MNALGPTLNFTTANANGVRIVPTACETCGVAVVLRYGAPDESGTQRWVCERCAARALNRAMLYALIDLVWRGLAFVTLPFLLAVFFLANL